MKNLNENTIVLYDDLDDEYFVDENGEQCEYKYMLAEDDFETTFNDFEGEFVICGTVGLWDGKREGYSVKVFNSIKEAIIECNNGFYGNICVSEEDGKLYVDVSHHDGSNSLEIRELTDVGSEMWNDYYDVGEILNTEGTTCDVEFTKKRELRDLSVAIRYYKKYIGEATTLEEKEKWEKLLENAIVKKNELLEN